MAGNEPKPLNVSTDIENREVRDNINSLLNKVTSSSFLTPYIAVERISKALAYYQIFLPRILFLEGPNGYTTIDVNQFGDRMGMTDQGEVVMKDTSDFTLYFEWKINDHGQYDIFCELVNSEELEKLVADYEDDCCDTCDCESGEECCMMDDDDQLNEIGDPTLRSYVKKATDPYDPRSISNLASKSGFEHGMEIANAEHENRYPEPTTGEKDDKKAVRRSRGVQKAVARLVGRRSLDEISPTKLEIYLDKNREYREKMIRNNIESPSEDPVKQKKYESRTILAGMARKKLGYAGRSPFYDKDTVRVLAKPRFTAESDENNDPHHRGVMDSYYRRERNPHKYQSKVGGVEGEQEKITKLTAAEKEAYHRGYDENEKEQDYKDWGRGDVRKRKRRISEAARKSFADYAKNSFGKKVPDRIKADIAKHKELGDDKWEKERKERAEKKSEETK